MENEEGAWNMNDAAGLAANYDDRRYIGGEGRVKRWTRMARNARSLLRKSVSRIVLLFHDWCEFRGTGFTLLTDINSFRRFTIRLKIAKPVPFDRWKLSNPVAETLKRRIFIREREFQIGSIEYELFRTKFCWWRGKNLTLIVYLSKFVIIIICASDARCGFKHLDKQSLGK